MALSALAMNAAYGELSRKSLRQDGPTIDVTLLAKCEGGRDCAPVRGKALIDTGADRTAVEWSGIDAVGAKPQGSYRAQGVTSEAITLPSYPVRVELGGDLGSVEVDRAAATPHLKSQGLVALLGRDVLEQAELTYDGPSGTYTLATSGGASRVTSTSSFTTIAGTVGVALALGAVAAWIFAPACACDPR